MKRLYALVYAVAAGAADSPAGKFGLGKPATREEIAGWDIDVRPDGQGLPQGRGTVAQGQEIYDAKCANCHGTFGESNSYIPIAGGVGTLGTEQPIRTTGSKLNHATTLFDYIRRAMPFNNPQTLTADEVYALTAYVLNLNDIVPADAALDQDSLPKLKMPNRDGFTTAHGFGRLDARRSTPFRVGTEDRTDGGHDAADAAAQGRARERRDPGRCRGGQRRGPRLSRRESMAAAERPGSCGRGGLKTSQLDSRVPAMNRATPPTPSGSEIKMNIRLSRRGTASPLWIAAFGWSMLGALVARCHPRSATLAIPGAQRAQFAISVDTSTVPAPQAPFDETPITAIETVGTPARESPTETATTSR